MANSKPVLPELKLVIPRTSSIFSKVDPALISIFVPFKSAFEVILNLLREGKGWVKLSGAYILSKVGSPTYADRTIVAKAYVNEVPGQLVWGSDWPHPTSKIDNKPDDAILMSLLTEWAPDEALQRRILVDNPARLYGFPE